MINIDELSAITAEPFTGAMSKFRELLLSSDGRAFLLGAGCSKCAGLPLTMELTDKVLDSASLDCTSKNILAGVKDIFAESCDSHIEDYLSEIVDLNAITDRRARKGVSKNTIDVGGNQYTGAQLEKASREIKRAIASAIEGQVNISTHQAFVASVHRPIREGRPQPVEPVDYLILNYDTIIEDALAVENIKYADGFNGGASAWWDLDTFEAPGLSARVIKIHGSIDWRQASAEQAPMRFGPSVKMSDGVDQPVLIWPSSTKYREAQLDPFAQLLDLARQALRPKSVSQFLLVVCGYSFGDSHINVEIDKALKESRGKLTIIAFTDSNEPTGLLQEWNNNDEIRENVLIFANRGFFHGEERLTSKIDLLWWKFENLTRILKGEV